ncbi:hypothetical protein Droror1_Dr00025792 [Drosera rotundifolia]
MGTSCASSLWIFSPLLKITAEFSVEELETALITPNNTLGDVHTPLLKVGVFEPMIITTRRRKKSGVVKTGRSGMLLKKDITGRARAEIYDNIKYENEKISGCDIRTSQEVTHPSITLAQARITSSDGIRCISVGMVAPVRLDVHEQLVRASLLETSTLCHAFSVTS